MLHMEVEGGILNCLLRESLPLKSSLGENLFPVVTCVAVHIAEACMPAYGIGYGFGDFSQFLTAVMLTSCVQVSFDVGGNVVVVNKHVDIAAHGYMKRSRIVNL